MHYTGRIPHVSSFRSLFDMPSEQERHIPIHSLILWQTEKLDFHNNVKQGKYDLMFKMLNIIKSPEGKKKDLEKVWEALNSLSFYAKDGGMKGW